MIHRTNSLPASNAILKRKKLTNSSVFAQSAQFAPVAIRQVDHLVFSGKKGKSPAVLAQVIPDSLPVDAVGMDAPFSSYARHSFTIDGQHWPTVEHYFQARKFMRNARDTREKALVAQIQAAPTVEAATTLAYEAGSRVDKAWDDPARTGVTVQTGNRQTEHLHGKKFEAMYTGLKAMFAEHPELSRQLIGTGHKYLAASRHNSETWGCESNAYGKILMQLRHEMITQKVQSWPQIQTRLAAMPHSKVFMDSDGLFRVQPQTEPKNWNKLGQTHKENPLINAARNTSRHILANEAFVVIKDKKYVNHPGSEPHYLILPRPKNFLFLPWQKNYEDMQDFLNRGTQREQRLLQDLMRSLLASNPQSRYKAELFRANNGHCREIPYLHIHFKPGHELIAPPR